MSLFGNKYIPLTTSIFFLETEIKNAVDAFLNWQRPLEINSERTLKSDLLNGDLKQNLLNLLPIATLEIRKFLFQSTQSSWVAFFDNSILGTDAGAPNVLSDILKCRMLRVTCSADGNIFVYKNPNADSELQKRRIISATKESGWKFHTYGEILPFEKLESYQAKKISDRLSEELIKDYLLNFNIQAFDETFYNNGKEVSGVVIQKEGSFHKGARQLTLEQAQNFYSN